MWHLDKWTLAIAVTAIPAFTCLAWLQSQWINESARLKEHRRESALVLSSANLERELEARFQSLDLAMDPTGPRDPRSYAGQVARFRAQSPDAGLLRGVYYLERRGETLRLWRLDESRQHFEAPASPRSPSVDYLPRLAYGGWISAEDDGISLGRVLPIIVSSLGSTQPFPSRRGWLILDLDETALAANLLTPLVRHHFGSLLQDFNLAIYLGSRRLFPLEEPPPAGTPEFTAILRSSSHPFEFARGGSASSLRSLPEAPLAFRLEAFPRFASSRAIFDRVRLWNLAISFGVLAVLGASLGLLLRTTARTTELALREHLFVASVSHELKTPIAVIVSAGDNLAAGIVTEPASVRLYGETLRTEGQRLREMIENILRFSELDRRPRPPHSVRFAPETVLGQVVRRFEALAAPLHASLAFASSGSQATANGHQADLESILENLIGNALKHGRPAGHGPWAVTIRSRIEQRPSGLWWLCQVRDPGPGIPSSERRRIFQPFSRGGRAEDRQIPGSGLGLAIARRCARRLGGEVTIDPLQGSGASFTVALPLAGEESPAGGGTSWNIPESC